MPFLFVHISYSEKEHGCTCDVINQLLHTVRFDNYEFEAKVGEVFSTKIKKHLRPSSIILLILCLK